MSEEQKKIRFIRKNGRIIPIGAKRGPGRPPKPVDPNAPVIEKRPVGRPRKELKHDFKWIGIGTGLIAGLTGGAAMASYKAGIREKAMVPLRQKSKELLFRKNWFETFSGSKPELQLTKKGKATKKFLRQMRSYRENEHAIKGLKRQRKGVLNRIGKHRVKRNYLNIGARMIGAGGAGLIVQDYLHSNPIVRNTSLNNRIADIVGGGAFLGVYGISDAIYHKTTKGKFPNYAKKAKSFVKETIGKEKYGRFAKGQFGFKTSTMKTRALSVLKRTLRRKFKIF